MEKAVERKAPAGPAQSQPQGGQHQVEAPQSSGGFTQYFSTGTLHIIAEIIALCGIVVYFSQKNASLTKHLEELSARVEEHEDILAKHDEVLKKIISRISQSPNAHVTQPSPLSQPPPPTPPPQASPLSQPPVQPKASLVQLPTPSQPQPQIPVAKTAQVSFTEQPVDTPKAVPVPAPNIMEMMGTLMGGFMPPTTSTLVPSITEIDETTLDDELKEELANLS